MKVFRIEHKDTREGPFNGICVQQYDMNHRCRDSFHSAMHPPGPCSWGETGTELQDVFSKGGYGAYHFGFRSKAQLKRWFRSKAGRRAMGQQGFVVGTYDVPRKDVATGNWQLAFKRTNATHKGDLDVANLR